MEEKHHALIILGVSILCMLTCGSAYSISAWSPNLKAELNCTQTDIELVGTIGNLGTYFGPWSGLAVSVLSPLHLGLLCAFTTVTGLLPMAFAILKLGGFTALRSPVVLGLFFAVGGFGSATLWNFLTSSNIGNFLPNRRGTIISILSVCFGLSASIYTSVYNGPLNANVGNYFIFLTVLVTFACITAGVVVKKLDAKAIWLTDDRNVLLDNQHDSEKGAYSGINSGSKLVDPTSVSSPDPPEDDEVYRQMERSARDSSAPFDPTDAEAIEDARSNMIVAQEYEQMEVQKRCCGGGLAGRVWGGIWYLLQNVTFLLLLFVFFLLAGVGLMTINNVGHLVQSLNGGQQNHDLVTAVITVLSLSNGVGRITMMMSDFVHCRKGVWLLYVCCMFTFTHFMNAFVVTQPTHVYFTVIFTGLSYGGLWAIVPVIVSENYGTSNFPFNLGWVGFGPALGSLFFNYLAGAFYDAQTPSGTNQCVGTKCYQNAFLLAGSASILAGLLTLILIPRTQMGARKIKAHVQQVEKPAVE